MCIHPGVRFNGALHHKLRERDLEVRSPFGVVRYAQRAFLRRNKRLRKRKPDAKTTRFTSVFVVLRPTALEPIEHMRQIDWVDSRS